MSNIVPFTILRATIMKSTTLPITIAIARALNAHSDAIACSYNYVQTYTDLSHYILYTGYHCSSDEFECSTGQCIHYTRVCDGFYDCLSFYSDENNCGIAHSLLVLFSYLSMHPLLQGLAIQVSTGVLMATVFYTPKDVMDTMTVGITQMNTVV